MELRSQSRFDFLVREFDLPGPIKSIAPLGSGHIHDTYLVTCDDPSISGFVLQKFNHQVFKRPMWVASNIQMVYDHFLKSPAPTSLIPLKMIKTRSGALLYESVDGEFWRVFTYIEGSDSFDKVSHPELAFGGARAFGSFIEILGGLDPNQLFTTIPDFHNLELRFQQLTEAITENKADRVDHYSTEIDFALVRKSLVLQYTDATKQDKIPLRVTHNDTKINNVLFRSGTTKGICVIDLDTVMPGLLLYDFGDMARTFCNNVLEDESAQEVSFRLDLFRALCQGFFESVNFPLSQAEIDSLKTGPWWMTYIMGIRFLADFLWGDVYYKISHPTQNLDRARNQFKLLADIEDKQQEIDKTIEYYT